MSDLNRRLRKVESKLNANKEQRVVEIVQFCDGPLPPDHTDGSIWPGPEHGGGAGISALRVTYIKGLPHQICIYILKCAQRESV